MKESQCLSELMVAAPLDMLLDVESSHLSCGNRTQVGREGFPGQ